MLRLVDLPEPAPVFMMAKSNVDLVYLPAPSDAMKHHTDPSDDQAILLSLKPGDFIVEGLMLDTDGIWICIVCERAS